jgi:lipoprotein NlpI
MLQMASWKFRGIAMGIVGMSALAGTVGAQQPAATSAAPTPGTDAKAYVELGMSDGAKGDLNAAVDAFNQAIRLDPKYAPAYYNRGFAFSLENKHDDAIANYTQAIALDPTYKQAYYQRGSLRGQEGNFDDAISDFSEVIKLDPTYAPAYYNRGHVEYFKGDLDGANEQLNQALTLDPNFSYCYFIRGLIRHAQGHREDAASDFQKSAGLNFAYASFWVWILEMEDGQHGAARKDLVDAMNNPQSFKPDDWPSQIGNFLLEKVTQDELIAKSNGANGTENPGHLCEAWFYIGMYDHLSGNALGAKQAFMQAVATGAKSSEEFVEANRELKQLQQP